MRDRTKAALAWRLGVFKIVMPGTIPPRELFGLESTNEYVWDKFA